MTKLLFPLLIIITSLQANDLSNKALKVEIILNSISSETLLKSFKDTSVMGKSLSLLEPSSETNQKLIKLLRKSAENTSLKSFSEEELQVLVEMSTSSKTHKNVVAKILILSLNEDPTSTMEIAQIMMDQSKSLMQKHTQN